MFVNNKFLTFLGVAIVVMLVRLDFKTEYLNDRVDQLEDVIIHTNNRINYTKNDVDCLAKNIYYEAGIEKDAGKYAVANVTINRVKTGYWGNTVCKVVYAKSQFSWTLKKKLAKPDANLYARCHAIAIDTLTRGAVVKGLDKSLFYHANYIKAPAWAHMDNMAKQVGSHIFYNRAQGSTLEI